MLKGVYNAAVRFGKTIRPSPTYFPSHKPWAFIWSTSGSSSFHLVGTVTLVPIWAFVASAIWPILHGGNSIHGQFTNGQPY